MKAKCPHCKNKWPVSRKYAGATITCPSCREPVGVSPSAPVGALVLTAIISAGLAVGVSSWMLSKETDVGRVNAAAADLQARLEAATSQLDKFNEEFARVQSQIDRAAIQPNIPQIARADNSSTIQIATRRKTYDNTETDDLTDTTSETGDLTSATSETGDQTNGTPESQNAQDQPQKSDQKLDDVDSLLIFTGVINRTLGPRLFVGSSTKKVNQFTYSNFKYIPPFVLDESAVIEIAPGVELPEDMVGVNVTVYVVEDGKYEYKETIGAIEIPKLVNKYRETNIIDVPEQQLVEFQGDQPITGRGVRLPRQPKSRKVARQELWRNQLARRKQQERKLPR